MRVVSGVDELAENDPVRRSSPARNNALGLRPGKVLAWVKEWGVERLAQRFLLGSQAIQVRWFSDSERFPAQLVFNRPI